MVELTSKILDQYKAMTPLREIALAVGRTEDQVCAQLQSVWSESVYERDKRILVQHKGGRDSREIARAEGVNEQYVCSTVSMAAVVAEGGYSG